MGGGGIPLGIRVLRMLNTLSTADRPRPSAPGGVGDVTLACSARCDARAARFCFIFSDSPLASTTMAPRLP